MECLPLDLVARTLSFLDGESLLSCACVSYDCNQLVDDRSYWENAAWRQFPHLKETYDIMPYNGDWKALFKDRNRRNRSAVFEWTVPAFLSNPERRYSPSFRVENYEFKVIVDPTGNPNVHFLEPGVSVYLACSIVPAEGEGPTVIAEEETGNSMQPWECCCAFSLTACNQQRKGRNVTWHSSMLNDRFHKSRKNWGVHSLLPLSKLKDSASGFVVEDSLKLKVRLRLLYLTVKVIRTSSLAAHRGFGVVNLGAEDESVLTYELFHSTTLHSLQELLISDLGLPSADHLRLWVCTQPWPDAVLCPREILVSERSDVGSTGQVDIAEDHATSPTLFSLLQLHMDGLGVARIWAECVGDGGSFCTATAAAAVAKPADTVRTPDFSLPESWKPACCPIPAAADNLAVHGELNDAAPIHKVSGHRIRRWMASRTLPVIQLWPDTRDISAQQALQDTGTVPSNTLHVLLFLKWLDPQTADISYLSHIVVPITSSLSQLFHSVGEIVQQQPQALEAHIESNPANWQPGSTAVPISIACPASIVDRSDSGAGDASLRDVGLENGQIVTFHLMSMRNTLGDVYRGYLTNLFKEAAAMYHGEIGRFSFRHAGSGPRKLGTPRTRSNPVIQGMFPSRSMSLKLEDVVNLFERFGYQSFRVRNVYYQHKHMSARQTLEYVIQGRHLGFCCDRCGATDFTGPRYKCVCCWDFDLCQHCYELPVAQHRYHYVSNCKRQWARESFNLHQNSHQMTCMLPMPQNIAIISGLAA